MYVSSSTKAEMTKLRKLDGKKKKAFFCMMHAKTKKQQMKCLKEFDRLSGISKRRWKRVLDTLSR